nr:unnamed protein product [Callosobruchus analis]
MEPRARDYIMICVRDLRLCIWKIYFKPLQNFFLYVKGGAAPAVKLKLGLLTSPEDPVAAPPKENTPAGLAVAGAEPAPPKLNTPDWVVVGLLKVVALAGGWVAPKELFEPKEPDEEEAVPKEVLEGFVNAEAVLEPKAADAVPRLIRNIIPNAVAGAVAPKAGDAELLDGATLPKAGLLAVAK